MVDLVCDEAGQAAAECRDVVPAARVLVFDLDSQRARDHAPHVEEAEAALVQLTGASGLLDDPRVEQSQRPVWRAHGDGRAVDADLRGRQAGAVTNRCAAATWSSTAFSRTMIRRASPAS